MSEYAEVASSFVKMLDEELAKVAESSGDHAAMVSKNAFNSLQIYSLAMLLTSGHDQPGYENQVEAVFAGMSEIIGTILVDLSRGLTDAQIADTMSFADRMREMQACMVQSVTAVKQ